MTVLAIAVVLLWIAVLLDVALTLALARRLREQAERLPRIVHHGLSPGQPAPDFSASTRDGRAVTRAAPQGGATVLGFFSEACEACAEHAAALRELAGGVPAGTQVLAIVEGDDAAHLLPLLDGVPTIVAPRSPDGLVQQYGVGAFPTFYVVGAEGRVLAAGGSVPEIAPALGA